jgi:hypothetical protein
MRHCFDKYFSNINRHNFAYQLVLTKGILTHKYLNNTIVVISVKTQNL